MKPEITELELLIDKINLLYQSIKSDGQMDKIEGNLFLKYVNNLKSKIEEMIGEEIKFTTPEKQIKTEIPHVEKEVKQPEIKKEEIISTQKTETGVNINAFENVANKKEVKQETEIPVAAKKQIKKPLIAEGDDEDTPDNRGLHGKLSKDKKTLADKINTKKTKDLTSGIDLNERIYFTRHLFKGDSNAFDKAIKEINGFLTINDANNFIDRELIQKLSWNDNEAISRFRELTSRKFS